MLCFIPPPQKPCANPNPENPLGFSPYVFFPFESPCSASGWEMAQREEQKATAKLRERRRESNDIVFLFIISIIVMHKFGKTEGKLF